MKLKKKKKIKSKYIVGGCAILGVVTLVTTPILLMHAKNKSKRSISVNYNNKQFSSKEALINYIKNDSETIVKPINNNIYTVNVGNDKVNFETYKGAIDFIKDKIEETSIYLKQGYKLENMSSIPEDSFVKTNGTRKYIVFQKAAINELSSNGNESLNINDNHAYTFAMIPDSKYDSPEKIIELTQKIEEARLEAARSFIQIHQAYSFNGINFKTKNELLTYIRNNKGSNFNKLVGDPKYWMLATPEGNLRFTDLNSDEFKFKVAKMAIPYISKSLGSQNIHSRISQDNLSEIKNLIDESEIDYIKVASTDGEKLEMVDMDSSTAHGNIFGNYFIRTGEGMNGVTSSANWNRSNISPSSIQVTEDISILKSIITYVLKSRNFNNILDVMNLVTLPRGSTTFNDYLKSIGDDESYFKAAFNMIFQMSKGSRYNSLDAIIALHSFLINKMIRERVNSEVIIKLAKYFDSTMKFMDSLLVPLFAPFLTNDTNEFNFEYLASGFNFYDENAQGRGINFQDNPYSYYSVLTGNKDNNLSTSGIRNQDNDRMGNIFKMLKAAIGTQSIMFNALRHNQKTFTQWEQYLINKTSLPYSKDVKDLIFSVKKEDQKLWDFSFTGKNETNKTMEKIAIWNNLDKLLGDFKISSDKSLSKQQIINNYSNYLTKYQNKFIGRYKDDLSNKIKKILGKYVTGYDDNENPNDIKHIEPKIITNRDIKEDLSTNTFNMMALTGNDENILFSNITIASSYDAYKHLNKMIENAIMPFKDRAVNFFTDVGTFAAEAGIAVLSAGAAAESSLIEEEIASKMIKTSVTKTSSSSFDIVAHVGREINPSWMTNGIKNKLTIKNVAHEYTHVIKRKNVDQALSTKAKIIKAINKLGKGKIEDNSPLLKKIKDEVVSSANYYNFGTSVNNDVSDAIRQISFNIVKNVVPGVSQILGIINSFSSDETQVYKYEQMENQSRLYWNGGRVHYSWWGLSATQISGIKDLKMLDPIKIVSAYSSTDSGYYYGDKIFQSLDEVKLFKADELIKKLLTDNKNSDFLNKRIKNIKWAFPLKGKDYDQSTKTNTINELIAAIKKVAQNSHIMQRLYRSTTGLEGITGSEAYENAAKTLVKSIKPEYIIKLPNVEKNIKIDQKFELPSPFYENNSVSTKSGIDNHNKEYVILDTNIKISGSDENDKLNNLGYTNNELSDPTIKHEALTLLSSLEDLSSAKDFWDSKVITNLLNEYAKNIYVPHKNVLFDTINNNVNVNLTNTTNHPLWTFEALNDTYSEDPTTIYKIKNKYGQSEYYSTKKEAILKLKNDENYVLNSSVLTHEAQLYKFDKKLFHSINEIYDYVIKNYGKEQ